MARHNIIFGRDQAVQQGHSGPQFPQSGQGPAQGAQWSSGFAPERPEQLEAMYARPAATGHDTGRMSSRDALNAITATLGTVMVVGFVVAMTPAVFGFIGGAEGAQLGLVLATGAMIVGLIGGFITALVNIFKKQPSPVLVLAYAGLEGLFLGGISGLMEFVRPGIALQAVFGTLAVAGTVLVMYRFGILRTSPKLNKIFGVAVVAYLLFMLVNIGYMLMVGDSLRTGWIGLVIGGLAVAMASYSLVMDFEDVERATKAGVPRVYAWRCAFGLAVTMIWLYIEILRIITILRGD